METASVVVSGVLAALLVWTAARKLSHRDDVVRGYSRLGVPERGLNSLAGILLLAAAGLIAGLWWAPAGVAASAGIVAYFLVAIGVHIRADDVKGLPVPVTFGVLAAAALGLRLAAM